MYGGFRSSSELNCFCSPNREIRLLNSTTLVHNNPVDIYSSMYGHTFSKSMDQSGKVANPARGELDRKNEYFPVRVRA